MTIESRHLSSQNGGITKLLVCGSRTMPYSKAQLVLDTIKEINPKRIIHGGAKGADDWAAIAAMLLNIPATVFYADWNKHGKAAGPIRNQLMLDQQPNMVLAFHSTKGITKGTSDMVKRARIAGITVKIVTYEETPEQDKSK